MEQVYSRLGLRITFVDMREVAQVRRAITPETTNWSTARRPTNPMMSLTDLAAIGDLTQARGLLLVVDNTFATPYFQRPLDLGADVVLHRTTKYLNGHSDMVGGMLVTSRDDLAERIGYLQNAVGSVPGPMDCWLCPPRHQDAPAADATARRQRARDRRWLAKQPKVKKVYYPGLPDHPQHDLAQRQMQRFRRDDFGRVGRCGPAPGEWLSTLRCSSWPNPSAASRA